MTEHRYTNKYWATAATMMVLLLAGSVIPVAADVNWVHFDNNQDIRTLLQKGDTLWVGTNGGLLFVNLLTDEIVGKLNASGELPGNSIRTIYEKSGRVYVGGDDGLTVFDNNQFVEFSPRIQNVRCAAFGPSDTMYVGTFGHGVGAFADGGGRWITREDSLLDNKVYGLAVVDTHTIFYATSLGMCSFRDTVWVNFQAGAGFPRGEFRDLIWRGGNTFYTLVAGRGVYRFNGRRGRRIPLGKTFPEADVAAICVSSDGKLWAAGRFGGIARYDDGRWQSYGDNDDAIRFGRWRCASAGTDGSVFFGSGDGTIVAIENGKVRKILLPSTLPSGYVGGIIEDGKGRKYLVNGADLFSVEERGTSLSLTHEIGSVFAIDISPSGQLWACTRWGVFWQSGDGWVEIHPDIEPTIPLFTAVGFDPLGQVWLGTHTGEVYRFDGELWVPFADRLELTTEPIHQVLIDGFSNVWALSRGKAIHRYNGASWESYDAAVFGDEPIRAAALDKSGDIVLITQSKVWRQSSQGWAVASETTKTGPSDYRSIFFDSFGRVYFGTAHGLGIESEGSVRWLGSRDGLGGREVTSIFVDDVNRLWVGFRRDGVSRISLESLW